MFTREQWLRVLVSAVSGLQLGLPEKVNRKVPVNPYMSDEEFCLQVSAMLRERLVAIGQGRVTVRLSEQRKDIEAWLVMYESLPKE